MSFPLSTFISKTVLQTRDGHFNTCFTRAVHVAQSRPRDQIVYASFEGSG